MFSDDSNNLENEAEAALDPWEEFRGDNGDPIRVEELKRLDLGNMPEDIRVWVMDNYFPETTVWRERGILICEIQEHLYTRYALSSKFVLIENTEASGHLYEIPHVTKAAECVTVILQEEGKGATWMFEDAYAKHKHWHKVSYAASDLEVAVEQAVVWAEKFMAEFADCQVATLPWLTKK